MKKRIALITLIILYLIVPAVIKKLPIYEYAGNDEAKIYDLSIVDKIKREYYKNFKSELTLDINGEKIKLHLDRFSFYDTHLWYVGESDSYEVLYAFPVYDKSKFKIVIKKGSAEYPAFVDCFVSSDELLSKYIELDRYTSDEVYNYEVGISGKRYLIMIDGYDTTEGVNVLFRGTDRSVYSIDLTTSNMFSNSELRLDVDEEQVWDIITKSINNTTDSKFNSVYEDKSHYYISKSAKGELMMMVFNNDNLKTECEYIYLFPRTAWIISKYVLGISATLMFTWVLVSEIKAYKRKKSATVPTEEEQTE